MSTPALAAENKALARRCREDLWKPGNLAIADQIFDSDAVIRTYDPLTPDFGKGPEAMKQLVTMYQTAFPDATCIVEDLVTEGDKVVARWTARGTHKGNLGTTAPTGKQVIVTGIDIYRIAGGKIKESWSNWDALGMLKQLGVS